MQCWRDFCFIKPVHVLVLILFRYQLRNSNTIWIRKIPPEKSLWDPDLSYPVNPIKLGKDQLVRGEREGN